MVSSKENGGKRVGKGWEKGGKGWKRVGSKLVAQALLGMMPAQVSKFDGGTISFQPVFEPATFFF